MKKQALWIMLLVVFAVGSVATTVSAENGDGEGPSTTSVTSENINDSNESDDDTAKPARFNNQPKPTFRERFQEKFDSIKTKAAEKKELKEQIRIEENDTVNQKLKEREEKLGEKKGLPNKGECQKGQLGDQESSECLEKTQEMKSKLESKKLELQEKMEERKGRLDEKRKEIVQKHSENVTRVFENVLEKIKELEGKIESRINTMEERGINVSEPKSLLELVPAKITAVEVAIENLKTSLKEVVNSENPREEFGKTKELVQPVRDAIKEAHKSLVDVVTKMKASVKTTVESQTQTGTETNTSTTTDESTTGANE